jgi:diguanylate cyclase (GGDEF)-like protein
VPATAEHAVLEQLKQAGRLPSPAGVALRVLELSSREDAAADAVARALQADPVLAGRVIKAANSACQGRRATLAVSDAVVRLGLRPLRQLVLGVSLIEQSRAGACTSFDYPRYWARCLATAVAAEHLSRRSRVGPAEDLFTLGLLHDIGALALASAFPHEYAAMLDPAEPLGAAELLAAERAKFGVTHDEATRVLLKDWRIPAPLIAAVVDRVATRNSADLRNRRVAELVTLAIDIGLDVVPKQLREACAPIAARLPGFGVEASDADAFLTGVHDDFRSWCEDFDIAATNVSIEAYVAAAVDPVPAPRAFAESPLKAMIVEGSGPQRAILLGLLESLGTNALIVENPSEALTAHAVEPADLYLVNIACREFDGLDLGRRIRDTTEGHRPVMIGMAIDASDERLAQALAAGFDDVLGKPVLARELAARLRLIGRIATLTRQLASAERNLSLTTERMTEVNQALARAAGTDVLTGLPNRRRILDRLQSEWEASANQHLPCSVIVVDLDHFKQLNDRCGHDVGDLVLEGVAPILRAAVRVGDVVGRLGGEEFIVVCPGADSAVAHGIAERIRTQLAQHAFPAADDMIRITASIGIATAVEATPGQRWAQALRLADQAMYDAKRAGRNRVAAALVA